MKRLSLFIMLFLFTNSHAQQNDIGGLLELGFEILKSDAFAAALDKIDTHTSSRINPGSANYDAFNAHNEASYGRDTIITISGTIAGTVMDTKRKSVSYIDVDGVELEILVDKVNKIRLNKFPSKDGQVVFSSSVNFKNNSKEEIYNALVAIVHQTFNIEKGNYTSMIAGTEELAIRFSKIRDNLTKGIIKIDVFDDILVLYPGMAIMQKGNYLVKHDLKYELELLFSDDNLIININKVNLKYTFKPVYNQTTKSYDKPVIKENNAERLNEIQCLCEMSEEEKTFKTLDLPVEEQRAFKKEMTTECGNKNKKYNSDAVNTITANLYALLDDIEAKIQLLLPTN